MTATLVDKRDETADQTIRFRAQGVTGHEAIEVRFQRSTPADAVAETLAEMLGMPKDVPWSLRDDHSSAYLDERPIGDQIESDAQITLTPRTHLGC